MDLSRLVLLYMDMRQESNTAVRYLHRMETDPSIVHVQTEQYATRGIKQDKKGMTMTRRLPLNARKKVAAVATVAAAGAAADKKLSWEN